MMLKKMRRRFITLIMSVVCIGVAVVFSVLYASTHTSLVQQSESHLELLLSQGTSIRIPFPGEDETLDMQLPGFTVYVNDHHEISLEQDEYYTLTDELLVDIISETYESGASSGKLENYSLRYMMKQAGNGVRIAYVDTTVESSTLRTVLVNGIFMGILAHILFFIISIFISKQIIKPISIAWEQQKQFIADASHELKTPLTVLIANADLLAEEKSIDSEQGRKRIDNIREESRRMRRLVETLLNQAKADFESDEGFHSVDFSYTVNETVLVFEPFAFEAGKYIEAHVEDNISVSGDTDLLKQLVSILIDNAVKYAYPGTGILVELLNTPKKTALLRVSNLGPKIPADEYEKIFTRFYRSDSSRQADGSYGLGLSIGRGIALRHGGEITVESNDEYTAFTVSLPIEK